MAGSYAHMTTRTGKLRNNESFCDMIENLGDAYEAAEECYGMIWWLAAHLAATETGPEPARPPRSKIRDAIRQAQEHHANGLRLGGVQRGRV